MMQALAQASSAMHYVRPKFAEYTELKNARHPLLDFILRVEPTANTIVRIGCLKFVDQLTFPFHCSMCPRNTMCT